MQDPESRVLPVRRRGSMATAAVVRAFHGGGRLHRAEPDCVAGSLAARRGVEPLAPTFRASSPYRYRVPGNDDADGGRLRPAPPPQCAASAQLVRQGVMQRYTTASQNLAPPMGLAPTSTELTTRRLDSLPSVMWRSLRESNPFYHRDKVACARHTQGPLNFWQATGVLPSAARFWRPS